LHDHQHRRRRNRVGQHRPSYCHGGFNTAIAIGNNATASATAPSSGGNFNLAVAVGDNAAATAKGGLNGVFAIGKGATSTANGVANLALASGTKAAASATGVYNAALAIGEPSTNGRTLDVPTTATATGNFNRAVVLGNGSTAQAIGGTTTFPGRLVDIGNNMALTFGHGSNSFAGPTATSKRHFQLGLALGEAKKRRQRHQQRVTEAPKGSGID
jgi:hypothetical protein